MPYGLFDYGGTINTMGLSPVYTLAIPEDAPGTPPTGGTGGCPAGYAPAQTGGFDPVAPPSAVNPYTLAIPEDAPGQYIFYGK